MSAGGSVADASEFSEMSEYSYESVGRSSRTPSLDTIDELMERFTLDCWRPDCTLKLRNEVGPVVLGADVTYSMANASTSGELVVKPSNRSSPWRRLKVDRAGNFTLRTLKLSWWVFTLDLNGHLNPFTKARDVSFRLSTKWDVSRGEIHKKKRLPFWDGAGEGRVHWRVEYDLPNIEGNFGNQQARDIHADLGRAHFSIPKLEVVVWPAEIPRFRSASAAPASEEEGPGAKEQGPSTAGTAGAAGASASGSSSIAPLASVGAALQRRLPWRAGAAGRPPSGGTGGSSSSAGGWDSLGSGRLEVSDLRAHIFSLSSRMGES